MSVLHSNHFRISSSVARTQASRVFSSSFTMGSMIGQILLDTSVLVRLNILVARMSFLPSISRETWATDWPEILIDHQSNQPVKPLAEGFQGLPSIALMKLGSSLPPSAETRPLS